VPPVGWLEALRERLRTGDAAAVDRLLAFIGPEAARALVSRLDPAEQALFLVQSPVQLRGATDVIPEAERAGIVACARALRAARP
jgi:hypothetical protein